MKKTLQQIEITIKKEAHDSRESAGQGGYQHDGGASMLESGLEMFMFGIKSACDTSGYIPSIDEEFEMPKKWEKYFITHDPEYAEYKRLKEKFEKMKNN